MFVKSIDTGIIHNTDEVAHRSMLAQRERIKKERSMCSDIDSLKQELVEIRFLLNEILTKDN